MNTPPTKVASKRILVDLLGVREEIVYLQGVNTLAHFPTLKPINYILLYGAQELFMLDGDS